MKIALHPMSVLPQTQAARFGTTGITAIKVSAVLAASLVLANCGTSKTGFLASKYGASASPRVVAEGERVPVGGGYSKVGKPYIIAGRVYQPTDSSHYSASGLASWYGHDFHGRMTANGEVFNSFSVSAAHPTLPLPSYIRVTNLSNGRSIVARVNDRGPFHSNRLIDVSERVAQALAFRNTGTAKVKVDYLGKAPQEGSDDARLIATLTTDGTPAVLKGDASATLMTASAEPILPLNEAAGDAANEAAEAPIAAQPVTSGQVALPAPPKVQALGAAVPLPPSRTLALSITTPITAKPVLLTKPVQPAKPAQVLLFRAPQPLPTALFKTAQTQVPVPVARPANDVFGVP